jgi:hypothetical protein
MYNDLATSKLKGTSCSLQNAGLWHHNLDIFGSKMLGFLSSELW